MSFYKSPLPLDGLPLHAVEFNLMHTYLKLVLFVSQCKLELKYTIMIVLSSASGCRAHHYWLVLDKRWGKGSRTRSSTCSLANFPASAVCCKLLILRSSSSRYLPLVFTSLLHRNTADLVSAFDRYLSRNFPDLYSGKTGKYLLMVLMAFFRLLRRPFAILPEV